MSYKGHVLKGKVSVLQCVYIYINYIYIIPGHIYIIMYIYSTRIYINYVHTCIHILSVNYNLSHIHIGKVAWYQS